MKETLTCLQLKIGSCLGCPVQSLASERVIKVAQEQREGIINRVNKELCPTGATMQAPRISNQNIW